MQLKTIHAGNFKLDGGAMFGVVPKTIWNNLNAADENNMCNWAMRCLLVEDGDRIILIDNGIGDKQSQKFFGYYHLNGEDNLEKSLNKAGVGLDDITDVVLTHLHFDHCGGSLKWNSGKTFLEPTFKNATYWSQQQHWDHAMSPNQREKPSFLKENFEPLSMSGQLKMIGEDLEISPNMKVRIVSGHTEKMMCPIINYKQKTLVYVADLIPSSAHVPVHYVMAYDIRPLDTMTEKNLFLGEAVDNDYTLFFEHDLNVECGKVIQTERGFKLGDTFDLTTFI